MRPMERRLEKMEANSTWGSAAEIAASEVLFMRVPEEAMNDPRVLAARVRADRRGKILDATALPAAEALPLWALVPLDRIPEALLDARIAELELTTATMSEETLTTTIAALRTAIAQEECTP